MPQFKNTHFRRQIARLRGRKIVKAAEVLAVHFHESCHSAELVKPIEGELVICISTVGAEEAKPLITIADATTADGQAIIAMYDTLIPFKPLVEDGVERMAVLIKVIDQQSGPVGDAFREMAETGFTGEPRLRWEDAVHTTSRELNAMLAVIGHDSLAA